MRTAILAAIGSVGLLAATVSADTVYTFTQIDVPGATQTTRFSRADTLQVGPTFAGKWVQIKVAESYVR